MNLAEPTTSASSIANITTTELIIPFPRWLYKQTEIKKREGKISAEKPSLCPTQWAIQLSWLLYHFPDKHCNRIEQKKSGASTPKCMLPLKAVLFQSVAMIPYLCYNASEPVTARMRRSWCFFYHFANVSKKIISDSRRLLTVCTTVRL